MLETYRSKIVEQFLPKRGIGKLKLADARKAIYDYRKASGSLGGTAELMMTYVENGAQFTRQYGDIDECFYSSIESALVAANCELIERIEKKIQATLARVWGEDSTVKYTVSEDES